MREAKYWIVSLLVVSIAGLGSEAFRNPLRSVEVCTEVEQVCKIRPQLTKDEACSIHCESWAQQAKPQDRWYHFLKPGKSASGSPSDICEQARDDKPSNVHCCCQYDAPWPTDGIGEAIQGGRYANLLASPNWLRTCWSLMMTGFRISKQTRNEYDTLCKSLSSRVPLTMLRLLEFVKAAAYLNFKRPKHPSILSALKLRSVAHISSETLISAEQIIRQHLVEPDSLISLKDYVEEGEFGGLGTSRLDAVARVSLELRSHFVKSPLARDAINEFILSLIEIWLTNARNELLEFNKQFGIHKDYDPYLLDDNPLKLGQFKIDYFDCKKFSRLVVKLTQFLNSIKRLLEDSRAELRDDHIVDHFEPMQTIVQNQSIYKEIAKANCK